MINTTKTATRPLIFIVDDVPENIQIALSHLKELDCEFAYATSGEQALERIKAAHPQLILMDVMMPEMTGWETYDRIKENEAWRKIPLVFLTARTDKIARDAGDFLGEDYIEKPFELDNIMERIDKILGR